MLQTWRWLNDYLSGDRPELTQLLRDKSGIYLIARPTRRDRVSIEDIVYIGLAGASAATEGTFDQRIRSHAAKLQRGDAQPGCPRAWAQYHQESGGVDALHHHALRLIVMPGRTQEDKASIKRLEDFLLLIWRLTCDGHQPAMPKLNTQRPALGAVAALFEGPVGDEAAEPNYRAEVMDEFIAVPDQLLDGGAPVDIVEAIWPNEDEQMEHGERLAQYRQFFVERGLEPTWNALTESANQCGIALRVISMASLVRRGIPGELRITTMPAGGNRAKQVHAIVIPEPDGHHARVELRLPVAQLPQPLAAIAEPFTRVKMQSKLRLSTARLQEVVRLFA